MDNRLGVAALLVGLLVVATMLVSWLLVPGPGVESARTVAAPPGRSLPTEWVGPARVPNAPPPAVPTPAPQRSSPPEATDADRSPALDARSPREDESSASQPEAAPMDQPPPAEVSSPPALEQPSAEEDQEHGTAETSNAALRALIKKKGH